MSILTKILLFLSYLQLESAVESERPFALFIKYEKCLASIQNSPFLWNFSVSFYEQPYCLSKLNISENEIDNMFRLNYTSSNEDSSAYLQYLPKACSMGLNRKNMPLSWISDQISHRHSNNSSQCRTRSMLDRDYFESSDSSSHHSALHLIRELERRGIDRLAFIGDSLTSQSFLFFLCDALRDGGRILTNDWDNEDDIGIEKPYQLVPIVTKDNLEAFHLEDYRNNWLGIREDAQIRDDHLPVPDVEEMKLQLWKELNEYSNFRNRRPLSKRSVLVINSGMHQTPERIQMIPTIAKILLRFAAIHRNTTIVIFRETYKQNFGYSSNGRYCENKALCPQLRNINDFPKYCCNESPSLDLRQADAYLLDRLNKFDPEWNKLIGWVKTFEISSHWSNRHIENDVSENDSPEKYDCTHFVYVPHMLSAVWKGIAAETKRLLEQE